MANFNPNSPCTLGVEARVARSSTAMLVADGQAVGLRLVAATSDTVESLWVALRTLIGVDGQLTLDVFDLTTNGGLIPQPALTFTEFLPSGDIHVAGAPQIPAVIGPFSSYLATTAYPLWYGLDSTVLTPFTGFNGIRYDNNEMVTNFFGYGYDFAVSFDSVAGVFTGQWITRVRSIARVAQYFDFDTPPGNSIRPYLWINGRRYYGYPQTIVAAQGVRDIVYDWFVNPETGMPWTSADIDNFDTATPAYGMGWVADPTGSANNTTAILQARLAVEAAATDPRVAVGSTGAADGSHLQTPGWHEIVLRDPSTGAAAPVTLTIGDEYLFELRRSIGQPGGTAKIGLARIEDPAGPLTEPDWTSSEPRLDVVTRRIIDAGTVTNRAFAAVLTTAGGVSLDSQPYVAAAPLDGTDNYPDLNEYFDLAPVNSALSLRQEFTVPTTDTYAWLTILCATVSEGTDADLTIQVRDSSNVAVGSPFVISPDDLGTPLHSWHKVGMRIPGSPITLTGTGQYYFDITSTAPAARGWLVQVLHSLEGSAPPYGPPSGSEDATFGGGVDRATVASVEHDGMDVVVSIATLPDTPTGFTAASAGQTCCVDHINLSWDPSPGFDCAGFEAWEIQRRDTVDGDWFTIARITDEAVNDTQDWESQRNTLTGYRLRVWRADGTPSDWTDTVTATAAMTGCTGLIFASNAAPDLTVFYADTDAVRKFQFPTNQQTFQPRGRGYRVVLGELEQRGSTFQAHLRVRSGRHGTDGMCVPGCDNADGYGLDVFSPLRSIATAAVPYVTVMNEHGNRWFASVDCTDGSWQQLGRERDSGAGVYLASVDITEVTDTPNPFNAEA